MIARPDGRRFVSFHDVAVAGYEQHIVATFARSPGQLHAHVDLGDSALVAACESAGFVTLFETKNYSVPFESALERLPPVTVSRGYELLGADQVDPTALFQLDEALRQDVPGTDGWVGNREWFDTELESSEFDPTGYVVAVNRTTGELVALVRLWNQRPQPRLGLLAVLPSHRSGYLATALLRHGLDGASAWGSATFGTFTARPALQRRLLRMGAACTGTFAQMATAN